MFNKKSSATRPRGAVRQHAESREPVLRLRYLLYTMLFAGLVWAAWTIRNSVPDEVMPFEHVNINGDFVNLSPETIASTVKQNLDGDYFTLDLTVIRTALLQLPWVQEVSVRRLWPSGLDISITEKQAVAHWGDASLLSDRGAVFTPVSLQRDLRLPRLEGPTGLHTQVWQFYVDISERLAAYGQAVDALTLDGRRSWGIALHGGTRIELGRNHLEDRLERLDQLLAMKDVIVINKISTIDMRYPNGFAVSNAEDGMNNSSTGRHDLLASRSRMSEV